MQQVSKTAGNPHPDARWWRSRHALAAAVCAAAVGAMLYFSSVFPAVDRNPAGFADVPPAEPIQPEPSSRGELMDAPAAGKSTTGSEALPPAAAALVADMQQAFGVPMLLPDGALEALAGIDTAMPPDELLIIEPGVASTATGAALPGMSPERRRAEAARAGNAAAMRAIIADLGSDDPATSGDAWAALQRLAHTGNAERFEALLAESDTDPDIRERARQLLVSLPYD